jgi:hypothetical protein
MRCFHEAVELIRCHEGDRLSSATPDDDHIPRGGDVVAQSRQVCASAGIGSFSRHQILQQYMYRVTVRCLRPGVKEANSPGCSQRCESMSDSCSEAAESVSGGNAAPLFRSLWEVRREEMKWVEKAASKFGSPVFEKRR